AALHSEQPRMRLPSPWLVSTRNQMRLLRRHIQPGMRVLEIGFAPGKILAWVASCLRARVSGLDYSAPGVETARKLFSILNLQADLRCEDASSTTFTPESLDLVYSAGVVEHFDDPRPIVRTHVELLRQGGTALISIPNYRGIYGKLQGYFHP